MLIKNQGLISFLNAFKYFVFREFVEFIYRKKPDEQYFLLQAKLRRLRNRNSNFIISKDSPKARTGITVILIAGNSKPDDIKRSLGSVDPHFELIIGVEAGKNSDYLNGTLSGFNNVKVIALEGNAGLVAITQKMLSESKGDFCFLVKPGDIIEKSFLVYFTRMVKKYPGAGLIYSDEDITNSKGNFYYPLLKPSYSPQLLFSYNYIGRSFICNKSLALTVLDKMNETDNYDSFLYSFILFATGEAGQILHLPGILYHNYSIEGSPGFDYYLKPSKESRESCMRHYFRSKNRIIRFVGTTVPEISTVECVPDLYRKISIIIPFRDKVGLLMKCIESILKETVYPEYEIMLVPNKCEEEETFHYLDQIVKMHSHIRIWEYNEPFNFSRLHNLAVQQATGDVVLFLNKDIEVITRGWLTRLYCQLLFEETGAVGAKLLYPNLLVQHAGVVVGIGGCADHVFKNFKDNDNGFMLRANVTCNYSAVTAACLLIWKEDFVKAGGFDEDNLKISFNDVDLCLKLNRLGKHITYNPVVKLIHHESVSRGNDMQTEGWERHLKEVRFLQDKWNLPEFTDPFYHVYLETENRNFELKKWYRINNTFFRKMLLNV